MASLSSKVQNALTEARILVLGTQVLVGFEFRSFFVKGYDDLPRAAQLGKVAALVALLSALVLIVLPSAWHRLVERGEDSPRMHAFTESVVGVALLPLAAGFGVDVLVATVPVLGRGAVAAGAGTAAVALACWYGIGLVARRGRPERREDDMEQKPATVEQKINHVLTEARTVLPGAQALVGFQLAANLADGFKDLPRAAQLVHVAAILLTALTVVLLVAPAAYHRIVEHGELTEGFHRVASRFVVAATIPLAIALGGDLGVVLWRVFESRAVAIGGGAVAGAVTLAAWLGAPAIASAVRGRRRAPRGAVAARA
jgi:hypothetical protein